MKTKKLLALVLALALTLAMAAGCGNGTTPEPADPTPPPATTEPTPAPEPATPEEPSAPSGPPIKIGHIADMTGNEASTGETARQSLEFAVQMLGGQIAGHEVEIVLGDAQSDPSIAVDVARQMVEQDGVVAIFGPTQIGHKSAVAEYIAEAGIPLVFYNATPERLLGSGNPWIVGAGGATPQLPSTMAEYAYTELGYRTVHTLSQDNTGGRSYIDPFAEAFEARGGAISQQQWTPVPCPDYAPYLTTLGDADALAAWVSGGDAIAIWGAWYDLGISKKMPMIAPMHGGFTDYFIPIALSKSNPEACDAMMGSIAPITYALDAQTPENQEFVKAWTEEFGQAPPGSNLPAACNQAILLFQAAMEATGGDTAPDKLIEAFFAANITGPEGHLYFDNSQAATKDIHIVEVVKLDDGSFNYGLVKTYKDVPPSGLGN